MTATGNTYPPGEPNQLPARVYVYRNLHKHTATGRPVYSIRDPATGRVVAHTSAITVTDARLRVGQKGPPFKQGWDSECRKCCHPARYLVCPRRLPV